MTESEATPGRIRRFFSNPAVGVMGSIASVIGVVLAIYFFVESTDQRELTYFVHPVKSIVVRAGEASELSVTLGEAQIKGDVTAAQLAFWNAGKEPIRAQHVLRPFVIRTESNTPILEARVRKESREVVGLELDRSRMDQGQLGVSWSILEGGDGGVVQLIFSGGTEVGVSASAVIEGQPEVRSIEFTGEIRPPIEQYAYIAKQNRRQGFTFLGLGALMGAMSTFMLVRRKRRHREFKLGWYEWALIGQPVIIIGMAVYFLLRAQHPGPPFGF